MNIYIYLLLLIIVPKRLEILFYTIHKYSKLLCITVSLLFYTTMQFVMQRDTMRL